MVVPQNSRRLLNIRTATVSAAGSNRGRVSGALTSWEWPGALKMREHHLRASLNCGGIPDLPYVLQIFFSRNALAVQCRVGAHRPQSLRLAFEQ
jgi:hypothetical protein